MTVMILGPMGMRQVTRDPGTVVRIVVQSSAENVENSRGANSLPWPVEEEGHVSSSG